MDPRFIPDILSLAVFIVAFRPLVRRSGAYVNFWFLGWSCLLVYYVAESFHQTLGSLHLVADLTGFWAMELCGLSFIVAAASTPEPQLKPVMVAEFGVPLLVQSALMLLLPGHPLVHTLAMTLFLVPAVHTLLKPAERTRVSVMLSVVFALFAVLLFPLAMRQPRLVTYGAISLLFLSAAYLYTLTTESLTRGILAAVSGLVLWGLSYPVQVLYTHSHPGTHPGRAILEMSQYLVIAGILLTLLEQQLHKTERLAMHDPLTNLPNRRLFEERLIETMAEARINRTTVACLVIDVDNFKHINDTLGHDAGDQLLRALAVRLSWHMSPRDILARTGGDEFTALLAGVNDEHHLRFIASAMMAAASVPIMIDDGSVDVRISVGIALSPDHADDIDELRRLADEAMYSAKRRGGSLLAFAGEE